MKQVHTEVEFREAVESDLPVIAVFKTTWCKDCHYIDPFMPDLEKAYEGKLSFIQVDRDELEALCSEYNILGIPSFVAFKKGQETIRFVSKLRKTREEIEQFLDRVIEVSEALT
jgi:thioredoxin-like negative regulator of GroEL